MESIFIDMATIVAAIAAFVRGSRRNPTQNALEDALALAIITQLLEQTAEPLGQPELVEAFRTLAREATASDEANQQMSNMAAERIWFLASQVRLRAGEHVTLTDAGTITR